MFSGVLVFHIWLCTADQGMEGICTTALKLVVCGLPQECYHRVAAAVIGVDLVGDQAGFEVSLITHLRSASRYVQVFRYDEFDTSDSNVAARREVVSRMVIAFIPR